MIQGHASEWVRVWLSTVYRHAVPSSLPLSTGPNSDSDWPRHPMWHTTRAGLTSPVAEMKSVGADVPLLTCQEKWIGNGLQDGSMTTRGSAELQRDEAHVDKLRAKDLKSGPMTAS